MRMPKKSRKADPKKISEPAKEKLKRFSLKTRLGSFFQSPLINILGLVLLFVCVFAGLRIFSARGQQGGQVKFVERLPFKSSSDGRSENLSYSPPEVFKGEVYETTVRLRETGSLGMAITLAVFANAAEQENLRAVNLEKIWSFIKERNLMPPGLKFEEGELLSASSKFIVRFRSEPFNFEILAVPVRDRTSPAILLLFPLKSFDRRTITYFQSPAAKHYEIPAPFAPLEKIVSGGWTVEQWRGELLPARENSLNLLEEEKKLLRDFPAVNP